MPIEKSDNPRDVPHKTFNKGTTYTELFGHSDGDGLTCGTFTIQGDPGIATTNPYGAVGIVTKGTLFLTDSSAPNERHELKEGQVFHVTKGTTYKWSADRQGEAFYVMPKPIDEEVPKSWNKPATF